MSNNPLDHPEKRFTRFFRILIEHLKSEILSALGPYYATDGADRQALDLKIGFGSARRCIDVWTLFASDEVILLVQEVERTTETSFIEWFHPMPEPLKLLLLRDQRINQLDRVLEVGPSQSEQALVPQAGTGT